MPKTALLPLCLFVLAGACGGDDACVTCARDAADVHPEVTYVDEQIVVTCDGFSFMDTTNECRPGVKEATLNALETCMLAVPVSCT